VSDRDAWCSRLAPGNGPSANPEYIRGIPYGSFVLYFDLRKLRLFSTFAGQLSESAVDRTPKGKSFERAVFDVKLVDGCEPFVSALAGVELGRIAIRCVS
jgi:hypothetical protein